MKRILLLTIASLAMLMADFTLVDGQLTSSNETVTGPVPSPTGSTKTNWGFQPFSIPTDSVTVPAGGNIQAAINSLPNGGIVTLEAGIFKVNRISFKGKSNIVMQGAGKNETILQVIDGDDNYAMFSHCGTENTGGSCMENIILRDFRVDGQGKIGNQGITFAWGVSNILFENIDIHNTGSGIIINNNNWKYDGKRVTFRNVNIYGSEMHGLEARFTKGVVVDNCGVYDIKQGLDFSSCDYVEVSNFTVERALWGGTKFPSVAYLYIHDSLIKDCYVSGMKLQEGTDYLPHMAQNIHLDNITVENSGSGIVWVGLNTKFNPPVTNMVVKDVKLINNRNNWDYTTNKPTEPYGDVFTQIRMNIQIDNLHEYGDNQDITDTKPIHYYYHASGTPQDDNVGVTSWPDPF